MPGEPAHCVGCGAPDCDGCLPELDPPRHCPRCGRWVGVSVTPSGWRATCPDHGDLRARVEALGYLECLYLRITRTILLHARDNF